MYNKNFKHITYGSHGSILVTFIGSYMKFTNPESKILCIVEPIEADIEVPI